MGKVMGYIPNRDHEEFAWAWSQQCVQSQLRMLREKYFYIIPRDGLKIREQREFQDIDHVVLFLEKCPKCNARKEVVLNKGRYSVCSGEDCSENLASDQVSIKRRIERIYEAVISEWKKNRRSNEHHTQPTQPLSDNEGGH